MNKQVNRKKVKVYEKSKNKTDSKFHRVLLSYIVGALHQRKPSLISPLGRKSFIKLMIRHSPYNLRIEE
jgi:hypothetical protein